MDEKKETLPGGSNPTQEGFSLLEKAAGGKTLTVRDDQMEFPWLLDSIRLCRKNGGRFRLIDSGKLEGVRLEWLVQGGADVYTSDEVDRPFDELQSIAVTAQRAGNMAALLISGSPGTFAGAEEGSGEDGYFKLQNLALSGVTVFISGSDKEIGRLTGLAACHQTQGRHLVFYHKGALTEDLFSLGESGAWIHMKGESLEGLESTLLTGGVVKASQKSGANCVFHFMKRADTALLSDLRSLGARFIFHTPHFDFRSPHREFEDWAKDQPLDHRAYYLYPAFFP